MLLTVISGLSLVSTIASCAGSGIGIHWIWLIPVSFIGSFLGLLILSLLFFLIAGLCIDTRKPQLHDSKFYRTLVGLYGPMVLSIASVKVHTRGLEQIPQSGRFLLVCNHLHEADPVILLKYFPKSQLAFIGKQETKDMFLIGPLMHKMMCQLINRENDREALKTILNCVRLINEDEVSIGVFPEGYIKPDRKLHRFRSGVFKIATKTKVPIVVCTITNTNHIIRNFLHLKGTDVDLHLLKVIAPEEYADKTTVEIADEVYRMMAEDLGPERVAQDEEEIS